MFTTNKNMVFIEEFSAAQVENIHRLFGGEWWTKQRTLQETQSCIKGSQICIAALDNKGELQGFCRVVTDFTFKALIFDVIVSRQYRGHRLGDDLMLAIKAHPKLRQVKHFELYCLPELAPFYQKHGFRHDVGGISLMRHIP
jgi:predicted GNAT family N-acyltransferase